MRITKIKKWLVEGVKYNWTLIKVYTDSGLTGIGEATNWPGSPLVEAACRLAGEIEGLRIDVDIAGVRFPGTASLLAAFDPRGDHLRRTGAR